MYLMLVAERLARRSLHRRGVLSGHFASSVGRLHYYESRAGGALPPIVILHGFGASATSYAPVLAHLSPHTSRLLAPEAPGHGFSRAVRSGLSIDDAFAAVTELLDHHLDEPAILFGNSLGGAMALRYAAAAPQRVRGLILSSPAGAPMDPDELSAVVRSFTVGTLREASELLGRLYNRAPWFAPLLSPDLLRHFADPTVRGLLESLQRQKFLTADELAAIQAPTLLLWGRGERLLPNAGLDFFRRHLPAHLAAIEEPADFGHCPYLDRPRQLAERITAFARALTS
jgi:pimeloyl-ACP methyl ester carboxylesterase